VVVVDNASKVGPEVPEGTDVVRSEERLSRGAARNLGLRGVETEFVLFLDADDLLLDGALERLEAQLVAPPECAACAMSILEGEVGSEAAAGRHSVPRAFVPRMSRARRLFALANAVWPLYSTQGGTLIRVGSVSAHAYDDSDGGEDWVLGCSLAVRGVRVLNEPGLLYRRHPAAWAWADAPAGYGLDQAAAAVRERLRADPAVSLPMRAALPAIGLLQRLLLGVVRPLKVRLRPPPRE
jgi:glycosyltransferase involved in cell wall biosynthesis